MNLLKKLLVILEYGLKNKSVLKLFPSFVSFLPLSLSRIDNKLITNNETQDDNNDRVTNHIEHCEINYCQSVDLNIVFAL